VLQQLGHTAAQCVVWHVDDEQALLLLATLNRLAGDDDPRKRAALITKLNRTIDVKRLAGRLPEDAERVRKLLSIHAATPSPIKPKAIQGMPVCLHFFLPPDERRAVERILREHGGTRERALLDLLGLTQKASDGGR
jgi:hypothetical protein